MLQRSALPLSAANLGTIMLWLSPRFEHVRQLRYKEGKESYHRKAVSIGRRESELSGLSQLTIEVYGAIT